MDKIAFAKGMKILTNGFPEYPCSKDTMDVYYEFLKHLHPKEFEWVITAHIKKHKWFPKISELLDELIRMRQVGRPTASEVWMGLLEAARQGENPPLNDVVKASLVICGGWEQFGLTPIDELSRRFKDFERLYNAAWEALDYKARTNDQGKLDRLDSDPAALAGGEPVKRLEGEIE